MKMNFLLKYTIIDQHLYDDMTCKDHFLSYIFYSKALLKEFACHTSLLNFIIMITDHTIG